MKRISFYIPIPACWAVAVLTASGCCPCRHLSTDTRDTVTAVAGFFAGWYAKKWYDKNRKEE